MDSPEKVSGCEYCMRDEYSNEANEAIEGSLPFHRVC